jgi:hypothetical protein
MQIVSMTCKCCGDELICPWHVVQVGQIVEKVAIMVQVPWKECPTCGYSLEGMRFNSPDIGVKHKQQPAHPGLKGLR